MASRQGGRIQDDNRAHVLSCLVVFFSPLRLSAVVSLLAGMVEKAGDESRATGDNVMVMGCKRDCRRSPKIRDTPSRDYRKCILAVLFEKCELLAYPLHICLESCKSVTFYFLRQPPSKPGQYSCFSSLQCLSSRIVRLDYMC